MTRHCGDHACDECLTRFGPRDWRAAKRYLLFGREVWRVESNDQDDSPGDSGAMPVSVGFVRDDLPTWHLEGDE